MRIANKYKGIISGLASVLLFSSVSFSQTLNPKPVLNQLTAIAYANMEVLNVVASYAGGISSIEITNSRGQSLHNKDCKGQVVCILDLTLNNITQSAMTVNVRATAIDGSQDNEMITATFDGEAAKIFSVTKISPDIRSISSAMVDFKNEPSILVGATPATTVVTPQPDGTSPYVAVPPVAGAEPAYKMEKISLSTQDVDATKKRLTVQGRAPEGIDFIELLEDGVFLDVSLCEKQQTCVLDKVIEHPEGGSYLYLVKMKTKDGALQTYSQRVDFAAPKPPEPNPVVPPSPEPEPKPPEAPEAPPDAGQPGAN